MFSLVLLVSNINTKSIIVAKEIEPINIKHAINFIVGRECKSVNQIVRICDAFETLEKMNECLESDVIEYESKNYTVLEEASYCRIDKAQIGNLKEYKDEDNRRYLSEIQNSDGGLDLQKTTQVKF